MPKKPAIEKEAWNTKDAGVQHPFRGTNTMSVARGIDIDERTMAKVKQKQSTSDNEQNGGAKC